MKTHKHLYFFVGIVSFYCLASQPGQPSESSSVLVFSKAQCELIEKAKQVTSKMLDLSANIESTMRVAIDKKCIYQSEKEQMIKETVLLEEELCKHLIEMYGARLQGAIPKQVYEKAEKDSKAAFVQIKEVRESLITLPTPSDSWCPIQ